ncbi:MAG: hypothetical protein EOO38_07870 [Cytophagaceae bacterium]|nr:MAG: hypothetical protein EOO38_07870 [Cytophagaceae bacterium]
MNDTWGAHTFGANSDVAREVAEGVPFYPFGLPAGPESARKNPNDGATRASDYRTLPDGRILEQNQLRVLGRPSINVRRRPSGATEVVLRRNVASMPIWEEDDTAFVERWGEAVLMQLQSMSRGPYSLGLLRRLGHPYGYDRASDKPTLRSPRTVPRSAAGRSIAHPPKVRGSVPTLSVINSQSGLLQRSWTWSWTRDDTGITLSFVNTAPYAWLLARGTQRKQPHGPFTYAVLGRLSALDASIRRTIYEVNRRNALERADAQTQQMLVDAGDDF